jgi:hypothetical protein
MGFLTPLFSAEELEALDETQRQTLRTAILEQIQNSPEIRDLLSKMLGKQSDSGA